MTCCLGLIQRDTGDVAGDDRGFLLEDAPDLGRSFLDLDLGQGLERDHDTQSVADLDPADLFHPVSGILGEAHTDVHLTVALDEAGGHFALDLVPDLGAH